MGEMRDSDWSKKHMLRSDWLRPIVATITTDGLDYVLFFNKSSEQKTTKQSNQNAFNDSASPRPTIARIAKMLKKRVN